MRKSKYARKEKRWRSGPYHRLSKEDNLNNESISILNQRKITTNHLKQIDDCEIYKEYVDDGYSGTNFNRPGIVELLDDIHNRNINLVIVKDISRLGRNYIETGQLLEKVFPLYQIRFISVDDGVDSYLDPDSYDKLLVRIKNIINENYPKDLSIKIRSSVIIKKICGEYLCSVAPFGYEKDPNRKNHLIINNAEAEIIRKIFDLAEAGYGFSKIASILNESGIKSPKEFRNKNQNGIHTYWDSKYISKILKNRVYCGDLVQNKYGNKSYKIKKQIRKDMENWIIVKNTHEAIIDRERFNRIQEIIKSRKKTYKYGKSMYSNLLKCPDCNRALIKTFYVRCEDDFYYNCQLYYRNKGKLCNEHRILSKKLYFLVLNAIKTQFNLLLELRTKAEEINNDLKLKQNLEKINYKINSNINALSIQKKKKKENYNLWRLGEKDDLEYEETNKTIEDEIKQIENDIELLTNSLNDCQAINIDWVEEYLKFKDIKELDSNVLHSLIDTIYVIDNNHIKICFKYDDMFKKTVDMVNHKVNL